MPERKESRSYDLFDNKWNGFKEIEESGERWGVTAYQESYNTEAPAGMDLWTWENAADEEWFYVLEGFVLWKEQGQGTQKFYLTCLNMLTTEIEKMELNFTEEEEVKAVGQIDPAEALRALNNGTATVTGMDVLEGKLYLLAAQYGVESKLCWCWTGDSCCCWRKKGHWQICPSCLMKTL